VRCRADENVNVPRIVVLWALLLCCAHARAQVSGRVAWVSDYRFRGVSLSQEQPAGQVSVNFDAADGWYVGAFVSSVKLHRDDSQHLQWLTYAGYSRRLTDSLRWEAGAEYIAFAGDSGYDYPEIYIGLVADRVSARLYYARRYFDDEASVLYLEANGAWPLSSRVRLFAHAGWLRRNESEESVHESEHERFDTRVGVGMTWRAFDLQLAWVSSDGQEAYPYDLHTDRTAWVLSVARNW
jgi:uncharacterized protein (TIGR02001 family)